MSEACVAHLMSVGRFEQRVEKPDLARRGPNNQKIIRMIRSGVVLCLVAQVVLRLVVLLGGIRTFEKAFGIWLSFLRLGIA